MYGSYAGPVAHERGSEHSPVPPPPKPGEKPASNPNKNVLVDLSANGGKGAEISIPGPYDPVPTTDELYMTVPLDDGLAFYEMKSLKDPKQKPKEIGIDTSMGGVYQSIGLLQPLQDGKSKYRIITASRGLSYRDYELIRTPGGEARLNPLGDGPALLCRTILEPGPDGKLKETQTTETETVTREGKAVDRLRLKKEYSLPMLSKDGRFVSILDNGTHTTKILEIKDAANGVCEQKVDLGMATGKVDFSYDKVDSNGEHVNLITFHKLGDQSKQVGTDSYRKYPSDDFVENVYVYDLNKGTIRRLTNNTRSNATYPAFRRDGTVVYIQHPTHPDESKPSPSKLVIVDPKNAREVSFDQFLPEDKNHPGQNNRLKALTALGSLWSQLCSPFGEKMDMPSAVMATLNLDARRCRSMVDKYWDSFQGTSLGGEEFEE